MRDKLEKQKAILEIQKRREEEELELQRKYSRTKLLNKLKEQARGLIRRSIEPDTGELYLSLTDDIRSNIIHAEEKMRKDLEMDYSIMRNSFISQLNKLIKKIETKEDVASNKETIANLQSRIGRISQYLVKL